MRCLKFSGLLQNEHTSVDIPKMADGKPVPALDMRGRPTGEIVMLRKRIDPGQVIPVTEFADAASAQHYVTMGMAEVCDVDDVQADAGLLSVPTDQVYPRPTPGEEEETTTGSGM